jgi:flagellar hook assembly protein FlgD
MRRVMELSFPARDRVTAASICTADGRLIRSLDISDSRRFFWDGKAQNGHSAGPGQYYLHCAGASTTRSFHLICY